MDPCRNWQSRLTAWFDDEVSDLDAQEVRAHLIECAGCRATVNRWKGLSGDLELLQPVGPDAETVERMASRFEGGLAAEVRGLSTALRYWNVAAAALLLVAVSFFAADRFMLPTTVKADSSRNIEHELEELLRRRVEPARVDWSAVSASQPAEFGHEGADE